VPRLLAAPQSHAGQLSCLSPQKTVADLIIPIIYNGKGEGGPVQAPQQLSPVVERQPVRGPALPALQAGPILCVLAGVHA